MLKDIYSKYLEKSESETNIIKSKIKHLETRKESLVDSFLDRDIEKDLYKKKMLDIELEIEELNKKLQPTSQINTKRLQKIKYGSELFVNLY
jgi:predicted  nucleic acid-binding Zn-ribbon protein